jgi:type VI secretion system protein ImpH
MAAESRASYSSVARDETAALIGEAPFLFEFFQAVRLLERFQPDRTVVGRFALPSTETVRFAAHNTLVFPASQIQAFEWREGAPPKMTVNFMGLTGPDGVLPLYYTQLVSERARARDTTIQDFLDIFNHRAISLFYQAWEKYRVSIDFERSGRDRFARHLLDFIGLGTDGLQDRQNVADASLTYYAGLLGQHPRSAVMLKQLLADYFEVPVEVEQFAGSWYRLTPDMQCCMEKGTDSERVAIGAVVGDEIWDKQGRVRVILGPLSLDEYLDFLPTGTAWEPLRALLRFYSGDELDFEVQLVLKRPQVPACELGREDETAPRLGWLTWAKTMPMNRDPGDTILQL